MVSIKKGFPFQPFCPFDDLYDFSASFAPKYVNLIHWFSIRKEVTTYFPVIPGRVLGLSYAPLKLSKDKKKFVRATPTKPFDGSP